MRKTIIRALMAVVAGVMLASCVNDPTFQEGDLLGLWQEDGTEAFVRFTTEKDSTGEYQYGREWNEAHDVFEDELDPYGNGWFKWKLVSVKLTEIHLQTNKGAEEPKIYTVSKLTDTELQYQDDRKVKHAYTKVQGAR